MSFLYFLESLRNPVLDLFFSLITFLGDETVFMVVGMTVFWCVEKYQGYFLLSTGFFGTIINQFLKMLCRVPRPWVKDPAFTIVESAREAATGYSFPSGHTQTSVGLYGGIARWNRRRTLRIVMLALAVLVPLSRMYLGVHTPLDVGVSVALALVMVFGLCPLFQKAERSPKLMYILLGVLAALSVAYFVFAVAFPFPADTDPHNLASAEKNAYTLIGCMAGLLLAYTVDLKYTNFPTRAAWWAQIIKVAVGLALVLAVKEGLRVPLDTIFGGHLAARAVRYFLMVVVGGVLFPMSFQWFASLGRPKSSENVAPNSATSPETGDKNP